MAQARPAGIPEPASPGGRPAGSTAIRTVALTHRFGELTALDNVDLTVGTGEIYAFLGRNGAGKTTLIRTLLGLLTPASGEVTVLGTAVRGGATSSALWERIGYLVEGPGLYPTLTVADHLHLAARYRRLSRSAVDDVIGLLDLGNYIRVRAGVLSLGNRQRLGLALALVHRPPLVILDEPVNGLDPAGVVDIRRLLEDLSTDGITVFMSTHIIGEAAKLADRVGIIHSGRLVAELSGDRLSASRTWLAASFRTPELAERAAAALLAGGIPSDVDGASLTSASPAAVAEPDRVNVLLVEAQAAPIRLAVEHEDLEELFLRLTEGETAPTEATGCAA
jgi:ABC-2 type transport system ATP-binding protein